jgi:hypothetical protein
LESLEGFHLDLAGVLPSFPSSSLTDLLTSQPSLQRAAFPSKSKRFGGELARKL